MEDADFQAGDVVVLKSGSPPMTVARTWVDDRYAANRQYANCVYYNPVLGNIEKNLNICVDLIEAAPPGHVVLR
jgi:uncharacterized protein YodC (DUF2158 family)